jgi:scyllo-inositol 2-dehydrogenase (NADP+)
MAKIRVGLIGYGLSGATFHAPLLQSLDDFEIRAVVTSRRERVEATLPGARVFTSPEELCRDAEVDLVVVAYPHAEHYRIAKLALTHGKHVVVEKPFTLQVAEADELIQLAESQNLILSVFHNRRWDGDFLTVKELVENGTLGTISTYEAHFDRYRPEVRPRWQEENGVGAGTLYNLGPHLIDQALVLFGLPETVYADVLSQRHPRIATDYFHIVMGYGRMRVVLHSGSLVANPGPRFAVHGDKGSFLKYGMDPQEDQLKAGIRPGHPQWGQDDERYYGHLTVADESGLVTKKRSTRPGCYEVYYSKLARALRGEGPVPVTATEARHVIQVIEYALESSQEGRVISCQWP